MAAGQTTKRKGEIIMWIPPSLGGDYERLLKALLNNPFLGGGGGGVPPRTHLDASSDPMLASIRVVTSLIGLVSLKEAASRLKESPAKKDLLGSINSSIAADIDDICPPWPWPGPPPWVLAIVSTLVFAANTVHEGGLRTAIQDVATQVLARSLKTGQKGEGA